MCKAQYELHSEFSTFCFAPCPGSPNKTRVLSCPGILSYSAVKGGASVTGFEAPDRRPLSWGSFGSAPRCVFNPEETWLWLWIFSSLANKRGQLNALERVPWLYDFVMLGDPSVKGHLISCSWELGDLHFGPLCCVILYISLFYFFFLASFCRDEAVLQSIPFSKPYL